MRARVGRIGNSRGLRIPKPLLEQTGLSGEVEIEAEGNQLIVRPARPPRTGWVGGGVRGDDRSGRRPPGARCAPPNPVRPRGLDVVARGTPRRFDVYLVTLDPTVGSEIKKTTR